MEPFSFRKKVRQEPEEARFLSILTLFRPGFFWSCGTGGGGGGRTPPAPNLENIKAMTAKLKGQIVRPKTFPLSSAILADDVI